MASDSQSTSKPAASAPVDLTSYQRLIYEHTQKQLEVVAKAVRRRSARKEAVAAAHASLEMEGSDSSSGSDAGCSRGGSISS